MPQPSPYHSNLVWWVAASAAAHVLVMHGLPGWQPVEDKTPLPLQVELRQPPPQIESPKPLPVEPPRPLPRERPKPAAEKPLAEKAAPREPVPVDPPRNPLLTAHVEAPLTAATPVAPEPKPAPPPEPPPRAQPAPAPPPAPVTPPRSDAAHLSNPPPNYPLTARRRGEQGTVLVRLVVTADGMAKNVGVEKSSGHPALDDAAVAAVRSWRFVPARQGGQAIEWPYTQPVQFKLD